MAVVFKTALHLVFEELLKAVTAQTLQTTRFKTLINRLQNTLISIEPVFYENPRLTNVLDHPQNKTIMFISYLNKGINLVLKTSRINFQNPHQKFIHSNKLIRLNNDLVTFFFPTELALNIRSITSYNDLSSIGRLSNLRNIRFESVSVSSIQPVFTLKNLKQLSFVMCENIGDALMSYTTESVLPNLTTLEIDMCYDLKQLPSEFCNLLHLRKLSITNCHELDVLPKRLGSLLSLEILRLNCCTKLQGLPESIGSLCNLSFVDISDCLSVSVLPEEIGELCGLRVIKMNGCGGLEELPVSVSKLWQLEEVICDEETSYWWMEFESDLRNLKVSIVEDDRLESFMKIVQ